MIASSIPPASWGLPHVTLLHHLLHLEHGCRRPGAGADREVRGNLVDTHTGRSTGGTAYHVILTAVLLGLGGREGGGGRSSFPYLVPHPDQVPVARRLRCEWLEVEAELHVVGQQLLWLLLCPVQKHDQHDKSIGVRSLIPRSFPVKTIFGASARMGKITCSYVGCNTCREAQSDGDSKRARPGKSPASRWGSSAAGDLLLVLGDSPRGGGESPVLENPTLWNGIPLMAPLVPPLQMQVGTSTPESWREPPVLER